MTEDVEPPLFELYYKIDICNEHNELIVEGRKEKSKSLVRAFSEILNVKMAHRAIPVRDITNTLRDVSPRTETFITVAGLGNLTRGIIVGTGTTPVSINDFNLATLIPHGTLANQLRYEESTITPVSVAPTNTRFSIIRHVRNDSPANITINEVGVRCTGEHPTLGIFHFLIVRDVITPRTITPLQVFRFTYEFVFNL